MTNERRTAMERHAQTILTGVITILLAWVGLTLTDSANQIARLEERLVSLGREVQMMRNQLNNQYSYRDAERDFSAIRAQIKSNSDRITRLESNQ